MVLGCSRHYRSGVLEGLSYTVLVDSSLNSEGPFCKGAVLFWGSKKGNLNSENYPCVSAGGVAERGSSKLKGEPPNCPRTG